MIGRGYQQTVEYLKPISIQYPHNDLPVNRGGRYSSVDAETGKIEQRNKRGVSIRYVYSDTSKGRRPDGYFGIRRCRRAGGRGAGAEYSLRSVVVHANRDGWVRTARIRKRTCFLLD